MATTLDGIPNEVALAIHRRMVRIRAFEEYVSELFLQGKLQGFVHTYIGQEAIAAGVCSLLDDSDYITSTHRGHGHAIAKGIHLNQIMAELFGNVTGACRGRGGSMHVADFSLGMLGANGIVGGGFGIAAGAALSAKYRGTNQVSVCFFGDGAINKGTFHEALNFAAVHDLPAVFICENNQYAQFTAGGRTTAVNDLAVRAASYNIPGVTADGNHAGEVYRAAHEALNRARAGRGPTLLNLLTYRFGGHYVGDAEVYRDKQEVEKRRALDPIPRWEQALNDARILSADEATTIWAATRQAVADAEQFAQDSPFPQADTALDWVFTEAADR
ncbi:MAG: pyruvate dehydrogenase (acetyl-transferring) E1 component subunit alpha [Planctomycetaceae bacterium]|nr:pyruvate dehydrogenase (acetyl-transferring) E1 component subunit alpha [Planctomycetaceae bacterium]